MAKSILLQLMAACALLAGCNGDGSSNGDAGSGEPPTFSEIYTNILHKRCADAVCHGGGAGNMDFSTRDSAYNALMMKADGPKCRASGKQRVVPGKPEESLIYLKLQPSPPCGDRMPLSGKLEAGDIEAIEAWIADDAPDN
ncbi:MAG TPA: hypothetical protein VHM19_05525 [Polyangiales bacterium]|jgi:hypothetical protein|nr:hypothetical protein [Polyangiales bacterium]